MSISAAQVELAPGKLRPAAWFECALCAERPKLPFDVGERRVRTAREVFPPAVAEEIVLREDDVGIGRRTAVGIPFPGIDDDVVVGGHPEHVIALARGAACADLVGVGKRRYEADAR